MRGNKNIYFFILVLTAAAVSADVYGESLPDPTRPADFTDQAAIKAEVPKEFINWHVRAIRLSASGRNAIVNGRLVRVGDEIDSAKIVAITTNTVVLSHDRKRVILKLLPEEVKKKTLSGTKRSD